MLLANIDNKEKRDKEIEKMLLLLRRVYDAIEMSHLKDFKMIANYGGPIHFPRVLGDDIFNYLSSKDSFFRETVIKRQKRWRNREKRNLVKVILPGRRCSICGSETEWLCADCKIDTKKSVYVCTMASCRREHEKVCTHKNPTPECGIFYNEPPR